jgi:hypothetical protein
MDTILSLNDARIKLARTIPIDEIALGNLDSQFMFEIIKHLLFHTMVLHNRTFMQLTHNAFEISNTHILKFKDEDYHFISVTADGDNRNFNSYGVLVPIPPKVTTNLNLAVHEITLTLDTPEKVQAYDVINSFMKKIYNLYATVDSLKSENISIRILDNIFPPNILNKLNPNWTKVPVYAERNNFTATHLTMFREIFRDLIQEAATDDGLALVLY